MISIKQNSAAALQYLAAQRQLYATTKTIFGWQAFLGGAVAVCGAFLIIFFSQAKVYVATWGALLAVADLVWLTPWQQALRRKAATIQEAFDCDVFSLPWNGIKAGARPDPELVKAKADLYSKWADKMPPLLNWYPKVVDELPLALSRIVCQRANCWWDAEQRRKYAGSILIVTVVTSLVVLFASLKDATLENFLLKVVLPLAPALMLGARQFIEHRETAKRLDQLKAHAESLWNDALSGKSEAELTASSRALQDEIFDCRLHKPPVFDFLFKRLRDSQETQMNHAAAHYVDEAKLKLGI